MLRHSHVGSEDERQGEGEDSKREEVVREHRRRAVSGGVERVSRERAVRWTEANVECRGSVASGKTQGGNKKKRNAGGRQAKTRWAVERQCERVKMRRVQKRRREGGRRREGRNRRVQVEGEYDNQAEQGVVQVKHGGDGLPRGRERKVEKAGSAAKRK